MFQYRKIRSRAGPARDRFGALLTGPVGAEAPAGGIGPSGTRRTLTLSGLRQSGDHRTARDPALAGIEGQRNPLDPLRRHLPVRAQLDS